MDKRPEVELYDIRKDAYCLNNLAEQTAFRATRKQLGNQLMSYLKETNDPRMGPEGEKTYESYKRYSPIRKFPRNSVAVKCSVCASCSRVNRSSIAAGY